MPIYIYKKEIRQSASNVQFHVLHLNWYLVSERLRHLKLV